MTAELKKLIELQTEAKHERWKNNGILYTPFFSECYEFDFAALQAQLDKMREALEVLMTEKINYMEINNLGDPNTQSSIILAKAALRDMEG